MRESLTSSAGIETVAPDREQWRTFCESAGAGEWFKVLKIGDVTHCQIFSEIAFGEHWTRLGDEIGESKNIRLTVRDCLGGDSSLAQTFNECYTGRIQETRIYGRCFSAGVVLALTGSKVLMHRRSKLLLHAPASFGYGSSLELWNIARRLQKATEQIKSLLKLKTELSDEVLGGWLNGSDHYFSSEQAAAFGIVDGIFDDPPPVNTPAPVIPVSTTKPAKAAPEPTPDEAFLFDLLRAATKDGPIKVSSQKNLIRELKSFVENSTIEEKSN